MMMKHRAISHSLKRYRQCNRVYKNPSLRVSIQRAYTEGKEIMESRIVHLKNEITGADVYLIGTMHISEASAKEVLELVNEVKPDVIMVELCAHRAARLRSEKDINSEAFDKSIIPMSAFPSLPFFDPRRIFEEVLRKFRSFFRFYGIIPGLEFLVAMNAAEKSGAELVLGDRNGQVTINRVISKINLLTVLSSIIPMIKDTPNIFDTSGIEKQGFSIKTIIDRMERMKNRKDVRDINKVFEKYCPDVHRVLVKERDVYMINSLRKIPGKRKIVAVVGLGHLDGMEAHWRNHEAQQKKLELTDDDLHKP